ncbi:MAG: dNTP triphosphohydrolase [Lewinellaceae bacterium]|nr:dNTP triphosphohydrolase [Lewinellaceae bacterium]
MLDWNTIISFKRFGQKHTGQDARSDFRRDYDKIIFLSGFRRLQNKTQVFPLPGNVFVHNRLTHSLEVSSVGRSIGHIVGEKIAKKYKDSLTATSRKFYKYDLEDVVASACLAHDLGNPAFGHSGEKAISNYFKTHADATIDESTLQSYFSENEWHDVTAFEGNANALRLLTHQFNGRVIGGHRLMFLTLASIIKYPCHSGQVQKEFLSRKKYGYFQSEKEIFHEIMEEFSLNQVEIGQRHPFVYLVEAADDICYRIIDMEDAHRIGIISLEEISRLFLQLIAEIVNSVNFDAIQNRFHQISDSNEAIAYLRAKCILHLVEKVALIFMDHDSDILSGNFNASLLDVCEAEIKSLKEINSISIRKIYNHRSVIEIELAGYTVMSELLHHFVSAALCQRRTDVQDKILQLVPQQFQTFDQSSSYVRVMSILDFVSGMTDGYATELYRKIKGIEIPSHKGF